MNKYYDIFKSVASEIDRIKLTKFGTDSPMFIAWKRKLLSVARKLGGENASLYKELEDFINTEIESYYSGGLGFRFHMEKVKALLVAIVWEYETLGELKVKEQSIKKITDKRKEKIRSMDLEDCYFVAHEYVQDKTDDLREAIESVFKNSGLKSYFADNEVKEGHILINKILPKIMSTRFGIYEISNPKKPNVFLELGMAISLGKTYYIIAKKGTVIPSDLMGLDRIEYASLKELKRELKRKINL